MKDIEFDRLNLTTYVTIQTHSIGKFSISFNVNGDVASTVNEYSYLNLIKTSPMHYLELCTGVIPGLIKTCNSKITDGEEEAVPYGSVYYFVKTQIKKMYEKEASKKEEKDINIGGYWHHAEILNLKYKTSKTYNKSIELKMMFIGSDLVSVRGKQYSDGIYHVFNNGNMYQIDSLYDDYYNITNSVIDDIVTYYLIPHKIGQISKIRYKELKEKLDDCMFVK